MGVRVNTLVRSAKRAGMSYLGLKRICVFREQPMTVAGDVRDVRIFMKGE
jgi:hypothetical protein